MEEFIILANKTLTGQEENLYANAKGALIKTIMFHNSTANKTEATLKFDSAAFKFSLGAYETKIFDTTILTKTMTAQGDGINIHVTALQL